MTRVRSNTRERARAIFTVLAAATILIGTVSVAVAGTETPAPGVVPPTDTDFTRTVDITQFDPANGDLQSVTIELTGGVVGDMFVENLSAESPGSGEVSLRADVAASVQADPTISVGPISPDVVETFTLDVCDTPDPTTVTGCDETPDFAGPAGVSLIGLTNSEATAATFTAPADLVPFVGTGTVAIDVTASGNSNGNQDTGNVFFQFLTRAEATVVVTYQFDAPAIDIEKATNGEDADNSTGPQIPVGDPVEWTYVVTNTGDVDLSNVTVTDDQGVAVSCPQDTLIVGESMTCTASGTATVGQYANVGTVTGDDPDGGTVTDQDPSHYVGVEPGVPAIDIEKATNGEDADDPTGPEILVGDPVDWTYVVTNTGSLDLSNVTVTDDQGVAVSCPQDTLTVGESMTCTGSGTASVGQYANVGTVTGDDPDGGTVTDQDPSHYIGVTTPPSTTEPPPTGGISTGAGGSASSGLPSVLILIGVLAALGVALYPDQRRVRD